jgi:hypothetical protein
MCYIANNSKLSYKINYKPCEIYCCKTKNWVNLDERVKKLLKEDEVRLAKKDDPVNYEDEFEEDFCGYLAQCMSLNKSIGVKEDEIPEEIEKLDLKIIPFRKMTMGFDRPAANWWIMNSVVRFDIVKALGLRLSGNVFNELSGFLPKAKVDLGPLEEIKVEEKVEESKVIIETNNEAKNEENKVEEINVATNQDEPSEDKDRED